MCLYSRLCAGCHQAHHLARRTQVRRPGRGHHSHSFERRAGGPGISTQEWTDPQVTRTMFLHLGHVVIVTQDLIFSTKSFLDFLLKVYEAPGSSAPMESSRKRSYFYKELYICYNVFKRHSGYSWFKCWMKTSAQ